MNLGYARYSGETRVAGGVRCEVRVDLRALTLRRTSCVYKFPVHLLGLQSKCTQGLSTGALGHWEKENKEQQIYVKEACQHLPGVCS